MPGVLVGALMDNMAMAAYIGHLVVDDSFVEAVGSDNDCIAVVSVDP